MAALAGCCLDLPNRSVSVGGGWQRNLDTTLGFLRILKGYPAEDEIAITLSIKVAVFSARR